GESLADGSRGGGGADTAAAPSELYLRFVDKADAAGVTVPIVPGIMPVINFARAVEFARTCGATVPKSLANLFEGLDQDPGTRQWVAAAICHVLGLRSKAPAVSSQGR
ncbi:MAG: methylenetetrahydrofolate reductase, partial [Alphaproteobacteria bacterium]